MPTLSAVEVAELHAERRKQPHRLVSWNRGEEVQRAYNGDIVLPSPELRPGQKAAVANLIQLGIDQTGMRIASTTPTVNCPPNRPGIKKSEDEASTFRRAIYGWWERNDQQFKRGRRARHLVAYGCSPVMLRPWAKHGIARWQIRDPLSTFPAACVDADDMEPADCIFAYRRTLGWLRHNYPDRTAALYKGRDAKNDSMFDVLDYCDATQYAMVAVARQADNTAWQHDVTSAEYGTERAVMLEWTPNRAGLETGMAPVVIPGRVTLDRPLGQYDGALGVFVKMARLEALEEIGIQRGVLPEQWIVSDTPGGKATVITYADARDGTIGEISGGTIETVRQEPSMQAPQAIDRAERYVRIEGRVPADWTGESASNVRTDRRGNTIMSATVDHTIAEAQQALALSDKKEIERATAIARHEFGQRRQTFWVGWSGAKGAVDYIPERDFQHPVVFVKYALPGTDVNGLAIAGGQRLGMGTLDPFTFMELDPLVDDPEQVRDRLFENAMEQATLAGIGQQIAAAAISPEDVEWMTDQVLAHKMGVLKAWAEVHRRAQERQAPDVAPVAPGSPEAQPGLAAPGMGAEAGTAGPGGLPPLEDLLRGLHTGGTAPQFTPIPGTSAA